MNTETLTLTPKTHHGRNVKRLREVIGVKQEVLAELLNVTQQTVSRFESKDELDDETLGKIAQALNVPMEALKNFSEDVAYNFINTFNDNSGFNYQCTFNPMDKMIELYERIIKEKEEKIALLEEVLRSFKK